ncbi:O-antigen ligase family protein [Candidatus Berkelbacteria bacterium]|nr:O-antigen ligase family protein [Candidatus Berkelbacteria bacterium]
MDTITSFVLLLPLLAFLLIGGWIGLRLLKDPSFGLFVLVFFLPFERIPTIEIAGLTVRMNHAVGGLVLLIWLLTVLAGRRRFVSAPAIPILLIFLLSLLLSALAAENQPRAFLVIGLTAIVGSMALLVSQLLTNRHQLRTLLMVLGITTTIAILFGWYQFVGDLAGLPLSWTGLAPGYTKLGFGIPRIQSFGQEPLYFGNFLLLPINLLSAFLLLPQTWFKKTMLGWGLVAALITLGLTVSRGALVGLGVSSAFLAVLLWREMIRPRRVTMMMVSLLVLISGFVAGLSLLPPLARETFINQVTLQDFGQSESTSGRLRDWGIAFKLWQEHPLLGIGPGNYGPAVLGYPPEPPIGGWPIVNNEYIELLTETGVGGVTIFLIFLGLLFIRSGRALVQSRGDPNLHAVVVGLTAALLGMLAQYAFFSTLYIQSLWLTFGFALAVQTLVFRRNNHDAG